MKTELETKREYQSYIEKSSPDFDAMWNKIESEIENTPQIRVNKNKRIVKGIVAAAACVVICIVGANYINSQSLKADENIALEDNTEFSVSDEMVTTTVTDTQSIVTTTPIFSENNAVVDGIIDEEPTNDSESESPTSPGTDSSPTDNVGCHGHDKIEIEQATKPSFLPQGIETIQYSEIAIRFNSPVDVDLSFDFDEYFVEDEMLRKTEYILGVEVYDVEVTENNTLLYTLAVFGDFSASGIEGNIIEVESASPFQMLPESPYIIFLYEEDGKYRLSFENAPQMEISHSGLIFHSGFKSLMENSVYVICPEEYFDEFYYDRMRFQWGEYPQIISPVVEKWRSLTER